MTRLIWTLPLLTACQSEVRAKLVEDEQDTGCADAADCGTDDEEQDPEDLPPTTPEVAVTPESPEPDDDLLCTIVTESTDPEGAAVSHAFSWNLEGAATGLGDETLSADETAAEDTWTCLVTPSDGGQDGTPGSASVTIAAGNQAPGAPVVDVTPDDPATNHTLTCTITEAATDPDGDELETTFEWLQDGKKTGLTEETVEKSETEPDETWTCVAFASDGELEGPESSDSVTIGAARYSDDVTGLGGTVYSASDCYGGCASGSYMAENAFDDNPGTSGYSTWHTYWTGAEWIAVDFGKGNDKMITRYGLMGASFHEGYRVKDFELQGSDDGESWTTIDSVVNANLDYVMYGGEPLSYWEVDNDQSFQHWRYYITANEGASEVGIVEIEMFEDEPAD